MRTIITLIILFSVQLVLAEELYQLRVGLAWYYELEGASQETVRSSINRSVVANGVQWFELTEYGERFWVRNTSQGQVEAVNYFDSDFNVSGPVEEALVYKFPTAIGETWGDPESPTTYLGLRKITVPAGTFECHVYRFDLGGGAFSESCIAERIGVVFNEFKNDSGNTEVSKLLRLEK